MAGVIDTIYTFRFLKILSTKWENTNAYKLGIIDADGTPLKKINDLTSTEEKKSYTPFVRLVFKLKRLMGTIPGGKSAVARYGAAVALIKEHSEEVESMGLSLKNLEKGLKRYIDEGFDNNTRSKRSVGKQTFTYSSLDTNDLEFIIQTAIGKGMNVEQTSNGIEVEGLSRDHRSLVSILNTNDISGTVYEEVTTGTGGVEGKEQPLGKKGEVKKRKSKKEDEVVNKKEKDDNTNEKTKYVYQVIGNALVRVDEIKRAVKKRVVKGKRSKKREYVPTKRRTRTGGKKLRGSAKAKFVRSHKKAYRKAKSSSAKNKRKRSMKKSRKYNK